jgi:hypothetical protein
LVTFVERGQDGKEYQFWRFAHVDQPRIMKFRGDCSGSSWGSKQAALAAVERLNLEVVEE